MLEYKLQQYLEVWESVAVAMKVTMQVQSDQESEQLHRRNKTTYGMIVEGSFFHSTGEESCSISFFQRLTVVSQCLHRTRICKVGFEYWQGNMRTVNQVADGMFDIAEAHVGSHMIAASCDIVASVLHIRLQFLRFIGRVYRFVEVNM